MGNQNRELAKKHENTRHGRKSDNAKYKIQINVNNCRKRVTVVF
jgi:hypothetical protein